MKGDLKIIHLGLWNTGMVVNIWHFDVYQNERRWNAEEHMVRDAQQAVCMPYVALKQVYNKW